MALKLLRHKDSHKGDNGKVLIIGGSEIYTGAPALVALSALRTGVDMTYILAPQRAADVCASFSPDLITVPLIGQHLNLNHIPEIEKFFERADVLAIGNGLGLEEETQEAVLELVSNFEKPMVIDADALKALKGNLKVLNDKQAVLTPNRYEFELLSDTKSEPENVRRFTAQLQSHTITTLVKAPVDIITNGTKIEYNKAGNAGMTVGGTGDILAGIVAGLIAQKVSLFDAAKYGVYITDTAGDMCFEEKGYALIASDLLEKIPKIVKEFI